MQERYLIKQIQQDIKKKMVFVGGPRQVGKTTLALSLLEEKEAYLNWDYTPHREKILKNQIPEHKILVFDELHKYRNWRSWLKGYFDVNRDKNILITGSAKLDYYRYGGDSLQGRYHYLRLHPLSVAELKIETQKNFEELLTLGGFPEPFFSSSQIESKRWSREYRERFIKDDLQEIEKILDIGTLELLIMRLPDLVGSPLSINALRKDLQKSFQTISKWIDVLERLYGIFRLAPLGGAKIRAVKKEQKHYHFDWTLIEEDGLRFENLVASHLLKYVHYKQDTEASELELRYFRDIDKREVDFVITEKSEPKILIECKYSKTQISPSLRYLSQKYPEARAIQLVCKTKEHFKTGNIEVMPAYKFLKELV